MNRSELPFCVGSQEGLLKETLGQILPVIARQHIELSTHNFYYILNATR